LIKEDVATDTAAASLSELAVDFCLAKPVEVTSKTVGSGAASFGSTAVFKKSAELPSFFTYSSLA
jgi:hypothetical protein